MDAYDLKEQLRTQLSAMLGVQEFDRQTWEFFETLDAWVDKKLETAGE